MTEKAVQPINISYHRSRRARKLRITIHPTQAVIVTVPFHTSLEQAKEFVQSKQAWLQKHLGRMRQREQLQPSQPKLSRSELIKAQDELFTRLELFSKQYNLSYRRAAFRCQKTRWGSCSNQNNINLNINLVFLPHHLQDYVLLHELCHIRHKNHSDGFWTLLDTYCVGKAKELANELKNHRMHIKT